jgi:CheY-like chemotaxis protein
MKKKLNCVLLIDDDDAVNFVNNIVIKKANVAEHIEITYNGREALEFLTNKGKYLKEGKHPQPDLIFLDINMPLMDGWEFLEEYHKLDECQKSKIIIVMLTTSMNPDDETKADKIPEISGFKHKPLTPEKLNEIMKKYFADHF